MFKELEKDKLLDISIIVLMTCLCLFSFFSTQIVVFESQDLTFHLNRFVGLANAFEERQILPKIYPYANNGFGYASPLFYCDLFLYPFGILYHFGLSAVWCYKLCVLFYTILGNTFVYLIIRKETNKRKLSLFASFLYLTCNYHLMNIFIRGALGEILAMTFVPLVIYAIYRILVQHDDCFAFLGVSFSLLVFSHLISSLLYGIFFFFMIVVFLILNHDDKKLIKNTFITIIKGTITAMFLCAWYLLPMLEQMYSQTFWLSINSNYNNINSTIQNFKDIFNIFPYKFVPSDGLMIILLNCLYIFTKKNKYINIILFYIVLSYLIVLGVIPGTYLNIVQFYFRLFIVIFPLSIIVSLYILNEIECSRYLMIVVLMFNFICAISTNLYAIKNGEYYLNNDATVKEINSILSYKYDLDYNHDELGGGEYLPYTEYMDYNNDSLAIKYIDHNNQIVDYIYEYERTFSRIEFNCDNQSDLKLLLPLSYYKGYKAYELVDDNWIPIDIIYSPLTKEVLLTASKGIHTYKIQYEGTIVQKVSLVVSGLTLVVMTCYSIKRKNKVRYNRKTDGENYER